MLSWAEVSYTFDKNLDLEEIEEFQLHLNHAVDKKMEGLQTRLDNASESDVEDPERLPCYKEHLTDVIISTYSAKLLGYELSIIALYKKIEIKIKQIVESKIAGVNPKKLSDYKYMSGKLPFKVEEVQGYKSFDELRLINNCIKHGGVVSNVLAKDYSHWEETEELSGLNEAYERLLPEVKLYVNDFVEKVYAAEST